jgi:hypothetical protein
MVRVPVGVEGGVPVPFWLAASHDTVDVLKLVGLNAADDAPPELLLLLLLEPQAATPMAAMPTVATPTIHERRKRRLGFPPPGGNVSEVMTPSLS